MSEYFTAAQRLNQSLRGSKQAKMTKGLRVDIVAQMKKKFGLATASMESNFSDDPNLRVDIVAQARRRAAAKG